ncbi:MAG: Crp/Fnr family transcriptional regulator [Anaerolineae bacterium]|jgi:CRP-like cAMP-binding protein|nr:Crp/Fnr family transcriptional regulator [Anaerolineae bacterium]MBT7190594.1 Crp/Fnr family transcriptional regulator [Anaerolineae bacterium]MBT7990014.1 Crp/Fnr family transcriptional regulator [Anaerolineae bacterium]
MKITPSSLSQKLQTLRSNIYFEGLDESALEKVAEEMQLHLFERKETIFLEEEKSAGLHILKSGSAKIYRLSPQGRQYIVKILAEGDTFNEVSVFGGGGNPVNAAALEKSHVWVIKGEILRELTLAHPIYAQKIINNFADNLRTLVQRVSGMAFYQVTHRLARLLVKLPEDSLSGEGAARLTQDQIAARLGSVREVIARSLKELERGGAIRVENRRIYIVDREKLEDFAEGKWE